MFSLEYWSKINVWSVKRILIEAFLDRLRICTLVFYWQKKPFEKIFFPFFIRVYRNLLIYMEILNLLCQTCQIISLNTNFCLNVDCIFILNKETKSLVQPTLFLLKDLHLVVHLALLLFNPFMHNVPKWSDALLKSCSICCKIFKMCLTILGQYALKG